MIKNPKGSLTLVAVVCAIVCVVLGVLYGLNLTQKQATSPVPFHPQVTHGGHVPGGYIRISNGPAANEIRMGGPGLPDPVTGVRVPGPYPVPNMPYVRPDGSIDNSNPSSPWFNLHH